MQNIKKTVYLIVLSRGHEYHFFCTLYGTDDLNLRKIEDDFYIKYSVDHQIYQGMHHEIEVVSPVIHNHQNFSKIHLYQSAKTKKWYVCWTRHIPSEEEAMRVLEMWSLGTVYTMENNDGFENLMTSEELDNSIFDNAIKKLKGEYGIYLKV